jgi:serine/threonine-protein kinase
MDHAGLDDPVAAERFDREAHTVARLAHPNIVSVYDVDIHDGDPYLVMELVDGATVAQLVAEGPLPVTQVVNIAEQICSALEAAHAAGIVHRDIKPANIMVTGDGRVKVCDFGIARHAYASAQALTGPSTAVGTSAYMAPEQATGDRVDARADLYALGCVIYTMVTGGPPFVGERDIAVLYQHVQRPPAPLRSPRGDVPAELDALVGRLLAKNPDDRPANAREVRDQLARVAGRPSRHAADAPVTAALAARANSARATAAVVSRTRSFPTSQMDGYPPDGYDPAPERRRSVFPLVAAFVMGLVIIALLLANLLSRSANGPQAGPQPPAGSTGSPSKPGPTPSTSAPTPTPASADQAVQALRNVLAQLVATGDISQHDANDLSGMINEIVDAIGHNGHHHHDVTSRIQAMRAKIDNLTHDSKLSITGATALYTALNQLEAVATSGGDNGGGGDNGDG